MITQHGNHSEVIEAAIEGIVTAVPANAVDNSDWREAAEAAVMTGVQSRRQVEEGMTTEDLALAAAERLLARLDWDPESISALVYVTQTPGLFVPGSVYELHRALGLPSYCPALQVNWSCAGYVYGLWLASKLGGRVLLIVGDTSSTIVDPDDRATAPLFGDAVSATGVEACSRLRESHFVLGSDGLGNSRLRQMPGEALQMDGAAVFNFTLRNVPGLIDDVLDPLKPYPSHLLFHQANKFMLDHLVKKCKLLNRFRAEQIPSNVDRFGNCSSASIPLLICDKLADSGVHGARLALFGYGAGWAWGGASIDATGIQCAELLELPT